MYASDLDRMRCAGTRFDKPALAVIAIACAMLVAVPPVWILITAGVAAAAFLLFYVGHTVLQGNAEPVLLGWLLVFPMGYYFCSFPRERPLITLDRIFIGVLLIAMCFASRRQWITVTGRLRSAALAWFVFLGVAAVSLVKAHFSPSSLRVYVEAFVMPAVLAWYVIGHFPCHKHLRLIHGLTATVMLYLAPIGIMELIWVEDLFPLPGAGVYRAGSGLEELIRVNGPFQTNHSYGLIGLIGFFFLLFLRKMLPELPAWQAWMHRLGLVSALTVAVLPMYRSIALTLLLCLFLAVWRSRSWATRAALIFVLGLAGGVFLIINTVLPDIYEERISSPENVSARLVQQQQNLEVFMHNPLLGVGVGNFAVVVPKITRYSRQNPRGVDPLDAPHNNWAAVLAETGLLGLAPYLTAQVLLIATFWELRGRGPEIGRLSWRYFVYIALAYGISGMTLTSGHYGDLNLWFMFCVAFLYKATTDSAAASGAVAPV